MQIHKILSELRAQRGLTQQAVAAKMADKNFPITASTLARWESGIRKMSVEQFFALCEIYGVDDIKRTFTGVADIKKDLLHALNYTGRKQAERYIDFLRDDPLYSTIEKPRKQYRDLKQYDLPVSAGIGELLDSDSYEIIQVDDTVPDTAEFALRISGDSMTPRFVDGQCVFVKSQEHLNVGDIGIFVYQGDAYIKKFGGDKLISLNADYKPIKITDWDSFRIYGKVVG